MHGLGNDFILINTLEEEVFQDYAELARKLCNRNFGIGADGLIIVLPSEKADIKMRIFNPDGSEAEMCGNGIRCFAKFVYEEGIIQKTKIKVETLAGIIGPELLLGNTDKVNAVRVDMGKPILERAQIPMQGPEGQVVNEIISAADKEFLITAVSMGNPHCVIFVPDLEQVPVEEWGPLLETHRAFPRKTNVEFAQVINDEEILMRVWERGAGVTLACGTGACATLVAAVLNKLTKRKVTLKLTGGDLLIEWAANDHVYMTGPAVEVFKGWTTITNKSIV